MLFCNSTKKLVLDFGCSNKRKQLYFCVMIYLVVLDYILYRDCINHAFAKLLNLFFPLQIINSNTNIFNIGSCRSMEGSIR